VTDSTQKFELVCSLLALSSCFMWA